MQSFGRMLRAESLRRALVPSPRCSTEVWGKPNKSIPGAAGNAGEGDSGTHLDSVGLAVGFPVAEGDPEPRGGQRRS